MKCKSSDPFCTREGHLGLRSRPLSWHPFRLLWHEGYLDGKAFFNVTLSWRQKHWWQQMKARRKWRGRWEKEAFKNTDIQRSTEAWEHWGCDHKPPRIWRKDMVRNNISDSGPSKNKKEGQLRICYILYTIFKRQWHQAFEETFHLKQFKLLKHGCLKYIYIYCIFLLNSACLCPPKMWALHVRGNWCSWLNDVLLMSWFLLRSIFCSVETWAA